MDLRPTTNTDSMTPWLLVPGGGHSWTHLKGRWVCGSARCAEEGEAEGCASLHRECVMWHNTLQTGKHNMGDVEGMATTQPVNASLPLPHYSIPPPPHTHTLQYTPSTHTHTTVHPLHTHCTQHSTCVVCTLQATMHKPMCKDHGPHSHL